MVIVALLLSWWLFTHDTWGDEARLFAGLFAHGFVDELRGAPDADDLQASAHFDEAGIAFDYPAVLRRREDVSESGSRTWSFEYGMFSLELYAPTYASDSATHLGVLADVFDIGGRSIDATAPEPGRQAMLCGESVTATRIGVKLVGDWSRQEGFDLPSPDGLPRMLIFDDELVRGENSPLAEATYARVFGSIRCAAVAE